MLYLPMADKKAAQVDAIDHLVEIVDGDEQLLVSIDIETQKNGKKTIPIMHTFFEPVENGCCGMSN